MIDELCFVRLFLKSNLLPISIKALHELSQQTKLKFPTIHQILSMCIIFHRQHDRLHIW